MHIAQLRQADLNLLVVFVVLAEERNVSRAAVRLHLSQPAVSRALQRARDTFQDDLLVRTRTSFELTPLGTRLLHELEGSLPRLDQLLNGSAFDPDREEVVFRLSSTDYATQVVCPYLLQGFVHPGSKAIFDFVAWAGSVFDDMNHGRLDMVLNADDGNAPRTLAREILFQEEFVCVVAKESRINRQFTLKDYLEADHIGISVFEGIQSLPDRALARIGKTRRCPLRLPYFDSGIRAVIGTPLVVTVPKRIAAYEANHFALKVVKAPKEFEPFSYQMVWHPRLNTDAAHTWLRSVVRQVGKQVAAKVVSTSSGEQGKLGF